MQMTTEAVSSPSPVVSQSSEQPLNIPHPRLLPATVAFSLFLLEGRHHELAFLGLDAQHAVLDGFLDDEAPDGCGSGLAEAVDAVDGLILETGSWISTMSLGFGLN